jgi:hypothetical protein
MSVTICVIQPSEVDEILEYESKKLKETIANENDRMLASWNSRWRKEALDQYLPQGWSFLIRDGEQLMGYFIAQPLLFFDGQTQSLWVEHLQHSSLQVRDQLCELACKLSREKHFQRVYFPNISTLANSLGPYKPEAWNSQTLMVKTTKV